MTVTTSSPENLIYEGQLELELDGISIGHAMVKVYEGVPTTGSSREMNPVTLIVRAVYNYRKFELVSVEGGIDGALREMKEYIEKELKKGR